VALSYQNFKQFCISPVKVAANNEKSSEIVMLKWRNQSNQKLILPNFHLTKLTFITWIHFRVWLVRQLYVFINLIYWVLRLTLYYIVFLWLGFN